MTERTRKGGHILFYRGSIAYDKAKPVIAAWEKERPVEPIADFKTLQIYRKRA